MIDLIGLDIRQLGDVASMKRDAGPGQQIGNVRQAAA